MQLLHEGQYLFLQPLLQQYAIVLLQQCLNGLHFGHLQKGGPPAIFGKMYHEYGTAHLWMVLAEPVGEVSGNKKYIVHFVVAHVIAYKGRAVPFEDGDELVLGMFVPIGLEIGSLIHPAGEGLVDIWLYLLDQRLHNEIERILSVFCPKCSII